MAATIDTRQSRAFSALKLGSILMVMTGHFFEKQFGLIWLPATVALLFFSHSSGYFTQLKTGKALKARHLSETSSIVWVSA